MQSNEPIHPFTITSHAKTKAWNEYVIMYLGLRLDKLEKSDFKSMRLYQGSVCLFDKYDYQLRKMTNAEMHKALCRFLEGYLEHCEPYLKLTRSDSFAPPKK